MYPDYPTMPFRRWAVETSVEMWQSRIWERCHGIDSQTPESPMGDPNPHHALIDAYRNASSAAQGAFADALKLCLSGSLQLLKQLRLAEGAGAEIELERLALERGLAVLHEVDAGQFSSGTGAVVREIFAFLSDRADETSVPLLRAAMAGRLHVGDPIGSYGIKQALQSPDLCVIGFRAALSEFGIGAVRQFLPSFVETTLGTHQEILARVLLTDLHTKYGCGATTEGQLVREIELARESMRAEHAQRVAELAGAIGIRLHGTKPVREAIRSRQADTGNPALVVVNGDYVQGEGYRAFVDEVVDYLKETTGSFPLNESAEKFGWERLAIFALKNLFDFCRDPYFNRDPRDRLVDVVRFGSVDTFTAVVRTGTNLAKGPLSVQDWSFRERLIETLQRFECDVGILGETAAALEVVDVLSGYTRYKAFTASSTQELREWIQADPQRRFACCDYGTASALLSKLEAQKWDWSNPATDDKRLRFPYKNSVPVGFLFPSTDQSWGAEIAIGFRRALEGEEKIKRWAQVANELREVGIEPWTATQIALHVFQDHHFAMQCAAWEDDFDTAKRLRDQLTATFVS
jgi:hypothetical protein